MSLLLLFNQGEGGDPAPVVETATQEANRPFIAWGNLIDASILSGGDWVSTLPLSNLKNRTLARVARSNGVATSATQFDIDLGPDKTWQVISLVDHNLSLDARYRIRASESADFSTTEHDSDWQDVWPALYDEDDPQWDDVNWWEGTYSDAERQGYIWTLIHKLDAATLARYVRIEIEDEFNVDSCVQIGRVFIANGWTPSVGIATGATFGWEDDSGIDQAYGGAEFFNELPRYRVARVPLEGLDDTEAYRRAFEIFRQAGRTGEVLLQWNGNDTDMAIRRSFVGRLRQLSPIEHPYYALDNVVFEIKENQR